MDDIFNGKGVEIRLGEEDDFLKVRETLTRIGIASKKENRLYQSCHILHKQNRYVIIHFKELFELDGKSSNFSKEDRCRRDTIAKLLDDWGLVRVVDKESLSKTSNLSQLKIVPYKDKHNWILDSKYTVGKK